MYSLAMMSMSAYKFSFYTVNSEDFARIFIFENSFKRHIDKYKIRDLDMIYLHQ